ncbi:hypothetical protein EV182_000517 [Spiromyces aspiralis]|uniref:Uncharacterized protein n=1 Tax=Spiromyces aspiralis TaxID=68401 RepID=A0ACC1HIF2_9FUNG|nr:hypothetical protein EV182_000517 [Spiromyces aspiralis]
MASPTTLEIWGQVCQLFREIDDLRQEQQALIAKINRNSRINGNVVDSYEEGEAEDGAIEDGIEEIDDGGEKVSNIEAWQRQRQQQRHQQMLKRGIQLAKQEEELELKAVDLLKELSATFRRSGSGGSRAGKHAGRAKGHAYPQAPHAPVIADDEDKLNSSSLGSTELRAAAATRALGIKQRGRDSYLDDDSKIGLEDSGMPYIHEGRNFTRSRTRSASVASNTGSAGSSAAPGGGGKDQSLIDSYVAAHVPNAADQSDEWILAKVKQALGNNQYIVEDVDDGGKYRIRYNQMLLIDPDRPEIKRGERVLGMYPGTTVFYKASVLAPPSQNPNPLVNASWVIPGITIQGAYKVQFDDDDIKEMNIPTHFVFPMPRQQK